MGFDIDRFKAQLKLAIARFSHLSSKSRAASVPLRHELGELLRAGKEESAKIKVRHVIREDFLAEAYEMIHSFCDDLLKSSAFIKHSKQVDESFAQAAYSVAYAAPRLADSVPELVKIRAQLVSKFGKDFEEQVDRGLDGVHPRLALKLSMRNPEALLVNRYLMAIATNYGIEWEAEAEEDIDLLCASPLAGPANDSFAPPPYSSDSGPSAMSYPVNFGNLVSPTSSASVKPDRSASSSVSDPNAAAASADLAPPPPLSPHAAGRIAPNGQSETGSRSAAIPDFDELTRRFEALKQRK